jgi:methyl-accepting chemotaxis protein
MRISMLQRFSLLCVPLVAVGAGVSVVTWRALERTTTELSEAHRIHTLAMEARYDVSAMSDAMKSVMLEPTNEAEARRKAAADDGYSAAMQELAKLSRDPEIQGRIKELAAFDHENLHPNEEAIMGLMEKGERAEAEKRLTGVYMPFLSQFNVKVQAFEGAAQALVIRETARIDAENAEAARLIIGTLLAGILLAAGLIVGVARGFGRRIHDLKQALVDSTGGVAVASEELTTAGRNVAEGASRGAACLQGVASAAEQVTSMTRSNADHARQAAELAAESNRAAARGDAEITKLLGAMTEISASARRIDEITHVIDDIAFQTNLLALNAAVEAARAGEHGAGFAVVAEAVRSLAQRSASAAKDINGLIRDAVERTDSGRVLADSSGKVLKDIVTSTRKMSELSAHIAQATAEQSTGIAQISESVGELDSAGHQNAAVAEEMAASAAELHSQAGRLQSVVHRLHAIVEGGDADQDEAPARAERAERSDRQSRRSTRRADGRRATESRAPRGPRSRAAEALDAELGMY